MCRSQKLKRVNSLLIFVAVYALASLFHYAHNATFLDEYPNMPAWLTTGRVYAAWIGVTAVGVIGYLLVRKGYALVGLVVLGSYAALGFDGFAHYGLAPLSAHTSMMNVTIWLEAATGLILLIVVARRMAGRTTR